MSHYAHGVRLCDECSAAVGLAKRAAKARRSVKAKPRKEAEAATKAERWARSAEIRAAVFARAGAVCELCRSLPPLHAHHLEPGHGTRRQEESVENVIGLCVMCHDAIHRSEAMFAPGVREWCLRNGYPLPRRRVYR